MVMVSCDYYKVYEVMDGTQKTEIRDKCNSKLNCREIEFKHAEYRDQNRACFLCDSHFREVFGEIDETERKARRDYDNAKTRYNRDFATAKKHAEYFNESDFKEHAYTPVQKKYETWNEIRKKICRYEYCETKLSEIRRVFVIRVYSQKGTEWANYYICSKDHWMKFLYRIGLEQVNQEKIKSKFKPLEEYF